MEMASLNVAVLRGTCSSPADVRVLSSEQVLAQLQVTSSVEGRAMSVPVAVLDPPAHVVVISDDGVGLPRGFSLERTERLGLQIVRTLVDRELRGSLSLRRKERRGTEAVLRVPLRQPR